MEEVVLMPIEVPETPKVYTTSYDNFKGVDFTNDATNVWKRRSPTGTNMLPDEAGRPFKRHGWSVLISNADLCEALTRYEQIDIDQTAFDADKERYYYIYNNEYRQCDSNDTFDIGVTYYVYVPVENCEIMKCAYFEIAGTDHIVVFTDEGVIFYNGDPDPANWEKCWDDDVIDAYDRNFFFEGNGVSAFYIYNNFRVWKYDETFKLTEITDSLYIPTVLIQANASTRGGVTNEPYNVMGDKATVQYNDYTISTWWGSSHLNYHFDYDAFFTGKTRGNPPYYKWRYNGSSWVEVTSTSTAFPSGNFDYLTGMKNGSEFVVVYANGFLVPSDVSTDQYKDIKVWGTKTTQFDTEITVNITTAPSSNTTCLLHSPDTYDKKNKTTWIELWKNFSLYTANGEDFLKCTFPTRSVKMTRHESGDTIKYYDVGGVSTPYSRLDEVVDLVTD